ncbi:MAG: hypothetical protein K6A65_06630 [Succinivibrionaceae bacterium]|nr:hypothetical protein [Succinivibrionaceae bacterium]
MSPTRAALPLLLSLCLPALAAEQATFGPVPGDSSASETAEFDLEQQEALDFHESFSNLPCPQDWKVEPNPSMADSLSYLHESGRIAVSVTNVTDRAGRGTSPEAYARVASAQMRCDVPTHSNLIEDAWSFSCPRHEVEATVYGGQGELVLLVISGRDSTTERYLEGFVRFLAAHAL